MPAHSRKRRRVAEDRLHLIGQSAAFRELVRQVDAVAPSEATVLLSGEAGSGKTLIAAVIHDRSARRGRPLVEMNCATTSDVRRGLFGHNGAFGGAANGGTICLEEVGLLDLESQARLVQALERREFIPERSKRCVRLDVRMIATTNVDLTEAVEYGRFRADLLAALNVCSLSVPPLRDRPDDIPILARHYLDRNARRFGRQIRDLSPGALAALMRYTWPGNVRELTHSIQRAVVRCTGSLLEVEPDPRKTEWTDEWERQYIRALIRSTKGVIGGPRGAAVLYGHGLRPRVSKPFREWFRAMGSS